MLELLLQFLGELLIQGVMELAGRSLVGVFTRRRNPVLATLGSFLWGAIAGGISLALMPAAFIGPPALKLLNLVLTPIAVGLIMAALGRLRARAGTPLALLDQFGYAFTFAFAIALVRYIWAK